MRSVLLQHTFRAELFYQSLLINALYLAAGIAVYSAAILYAREHGLLLQMV